MMRTVLAIIQPPPLDLGMPEVATAILVSAVIFAFTGKKLREDMRRYFGV
jgi:hypothetical protein